MKWNNKKIIINNYLQVFNDYSKDIKEVIRSAILDDTPIEPYINKCKNNPYLLWQIKMSIDEGLDSSWYDIINSGEILLLLRGLNKKSINIKPLKGYFSKGLSENHYKYIIKWYGEGYALSKYNFNILPDSLLECFDYGLSLGYPMYIFNNGVLFTKEYIMCCLKILSNGYQINKFLNGDWDLENLELLSKFSKSKYYNKLIGFVSKSITPSVLEELYECCKVGMPLDDISAIDGYTYVYSAIHISKIREAYLSNLDYKSMLDTNLSIADLNSMLDEMKYSASKKVSGRLRKNYIKIY